MINISGLKVVKDQRCLLNLDELSIDSSAFTVILGHNGSGKSTLMKCMAKQLEFDAGAIEVKGQELKRYSSKALARTLAYLPQKLPATEGLTVYELVRLGRYPWRGVFGQWNSQDAEVIEQAMIKTDVQQYQNELAGHLSGGELQRAWVSMLLAQESPILLMDEPTSALDLSHQYELMKLLKELNQHSGKGVIMVLHDLDLAARFADHVVALKQGELMYAGPIDEFLTDQLLSGLFNVSIQVLDHPNQKTKITVINS